MTDFDNVVRLAELIDRVDKSELPEDVQELERGLAKLNPTYLHALVMVSKAIHEGKGYHITTDNPETVRAVLAFAAHLGAKVEINEALKADDGTTRILLHPPTKQ